MKKYMYIFIFLLSIVLLIVLIYFVTSKHKAYKELENKWQIVIKQNSENKIKEREQWSPNGDGFYYYSIDLKNNSESIKQVEKDMIIGNFKKLPITIGLPPNKMPLGDESIKTGYYKCIFEKNDKRNFQIFIYDIINKRIIIYYQLL